MVWIIGTEKTKSSNFASAVKVSFHEFQEWIECKFPHYAVNLYRMSSTDIFKIEMIIQMAHVQLFEHWRNCFLNKSWETICWIFFNASNPAFDHSFLDQKKKACKDSLRGNYEI